jgi:tetrahydromethanopterin S-methyltransferase subunit C
MHTGYGLVIGAAIGLLVATLFADQIWIAPVIGAALGIVVGAVLDARRSRHP